VRRARPAGDTKDEQQAEAQDQQTAAADDAARPAKREPKWRNAMSEMLPADAPVALPSVPSLSSIAAPGLNWLDRWVDVAQVAPPSFLGRAAAPEVSSSAGQKADPMVTPARLIMVFLGIVAILVVIELLF